MEGVLAGKRVVIVEDEGMTQMQLRLIVERSGMEVVGAAGTGEQGVDVARRELPDIVLMDIAMPGEVDGLEAARRILEEHSCCVVVMTANSDREEQARSVGACAYVSKPITAESLVPVIEEALVAYGGGRT